MKKKLLLVLSLLLILVACGNNVSMHDLWSDYQGEVFLNLSVDDWSDLLEKDLKGLARYEFLYLDGKNMHIIESFAKIENDNYVSTEDGLDSTEETIVPLEDYFISIPKTRFFMRNYNSLGYTSFSSIFWFDDNETCIHSITLDQALDEELTLGNLELDDIIPKIQDREEYILDSQDSCYYNHIEGASYNHIREAFVDDLKIEEKLSFESPFEFRDMKINFIDIANWSKIDNRYSDYNGKDVFVLSVELENISTEKNKLNMFAYKAFDPDGKELPSISAYFDNTLAHHDELLAGGKTHAVYPILYRGDGEYQIHFEDYGGDKVVYLDIKK